MMRHILSLVLAFSLAGGTAFAESIRSSIPAAAAAAGAAQARQRGRGENPMMVPGLVLMGGGASLATLAMLAPSGVKCKDTGGRSFGVECGTTANKGLLFTGLGAVGVGGYLIMRGEKQRSAPFVAPTVGGVVAGHRFTF
jgi:hypothetical protein